MVLLKLIVCFMLRRASVEATGVMEEGMVGIDVGAGFSAGGVVLEAGPGVSRDLVCLPAIEA